MSIPATPETGRMLEMASRLNAEDVEELIVAILLAWKELHPDADVITDVVFDVVSAMVIDGGGAVIEHDIDDPDDDFFDEDGEWWKIT